MADTIFLDKQLVTVNDMQLSNVDSDITTTMITETFEAIGLIVTDQVAKVNEAIASAVALAVELGLPTNWTDGLDDIVIIDVPPIDVTTLPTLPLPGDLPGYETITWGTNDTSLSTYSSDVYVTLLAKILSDITTGGTGIQTAIEDAIHERNLEKQRVANEKAYNLGISELSSRCLSFPQGFAQTIANQVSIEIDKQSHNSANEIDIAISELAQKNMNAALDRATNLEGLLRGFWKDFNTMKLAGVKAKTDELIAHVETITKEREGILKLYETEAGIYKVTTEAQKNWYDAIAESQKAQLQKSTLELQKLEVELKAKLDSYIAVNSLREKIITASGGFSTQLAASAINAENVSMSANIGRSTNFSESYGHNENQSKTQTQNISEGHDYNAKGADL